jgi:hypothetical protein
VFERLFGAGEYNLSPDVRERRAAARGSILDLVQRDTQRLRGELGRADQRKIDEYLFAVREVEKQIQRSEREHPDLSGMIEKPAGVPVLFRDYLKVMFDLQILAMQADLTRVVTMMYGREGSQRTYGEIGIPEPHHPLTHHRGNQEWIEKFTRLNVYHAQNFAYFLGRLKSTPDGDGSLLDHSIVVYGSGLSDPNAHSKINLPTVLAGRGNGQLNPGRHIVYPGGTPMSNLFMTLLSCMNVPQDSFGDSTGRLQHLADV